MNIKTILATALLILSNMLFAGWADMNTGINDKLTGVVFWNNNGLLSGHHGLYYTTTGGNGSASWSRFEILSNPSDSLIYNHTRFNHAFSYSSNIMFACGEDTVNHRAVIMKITFPALTYSMIYYGQPNSSLNRISNTSNNGFYYAAGNDGLIVRFTSSTSAVVNTGFAYDLYAISFFATTFMIGADSVLITGTINNNVFSYQFFHSPQNTFRDVIDNGSSLGYSVGNSYFKRYYAALTENPYFAYGPLNANCMLELNSSHFVGTDHGIFRSNSARYFLEWQPTSLNHCINSIWQAITSPYNMYACGNNGILLVSSDLGGATIPYAELMTPNGCVATGVMLTGIKGSSNICKWYVNGTLVSTSCSDNQYFFPTAGQHTITLIVNNGTYSDTATQVISIVPYPDINKPVTVGDSVLCHEEPVIITIDSSQSDVYYVLKKFGSTGDYGTSQAGNNGAISFTSIPLNTSGYYYIQACSSVAPCNRDFTDSIYIYVEKTEAHAHAGKLNAVPGEQVPFFASMNDAQHCLWTFPPTSNTVSSNLLQLNNSFSLPGLVNAKLLCWSDNGCYDSTEINCPMIYTPPSMTDSCWTLANKGTDGNCVDALVAGLKSLVPSKTGYLACGHYNAEIFASRYGDAYTLPADLGGFAAKYTNDGVLKWIVYTKQVNTACDGMTSVIEDKSGNIYLCGNTFGYFFDNCGDSTNLFYSWSGANHVIKLDSTGKLLWRLSAAGFGTKKLALDHSGNLIVTAYTGGGGPVFYLNGVQDYTMSVATGNYFVLKVSPDGHVLWDFRIFLDATNGRDLVKAGCDHNDNVYITGYMEYYANFYSHDSTYAHVLQGIQGDLGPKLFLAKYDSSGRFIWAIRSRAIGQNNHTTLPYDMVTDSLGNSYITGNNGCIGNFLTHIFENSDGTTTGASSGEYFLAKVNTNGICKWIQGNMYSFYGYGYSMTLNGDEISVAGRIFPNGGTNITNQFTSANNIQASLTIERVDYFIAVYDTAGNLKVIMTNGMNQPGISWGTNSIKSIFRKGDGSFYLALNYFLYPPDEYVNFGDTLAPTVGYDGAVTKFFQDCSQITYPSIYTGTAISGNSNIYLYPNPSKDIVYVEGLNCVNEVKIVLRNILGNKVLVTKECTHFDVSNLSEGIYFVQVMENGAASANIKLVKH